MAEVAAAVPAAPSASGRPEKDTVRIGYLPLTDCASLVMAALLGFDEKYGVKIVLSKEASWSGLRDKLINGELDAAHVLYGLVYGVQLGIGAAKQDMAVLMGLNQNGQAITLSSQLARQGAVDGPSLARLMHAAPRREAPGEARTYTFAQTFPTGTHAMWLYYWLAAHGIDPLRQAKVITVPPSQMVASMRAGHIDGFCVGEPWGRRAVMDGVGVAAASTATIWPDHPEKVLGVTAEFAQTYPRTCRAMVAAVLDASRWIDASAANRARMAATLAGAAYLNTSVDAIDPDRLSFYRDGAVNFPYLSDGMWFMTQQRRWGLLKDDPDYLAVASAVHRLDLYRDAAALTGTPLPAAPMRRSTLLDGVVWDGADPAGYAAAFPIRYR